MCSSMEILSSGRSTVLLNFNNLEKICSYETSQNDSVDFQFFNGKNIFTQINKKNGLEFLQIKQKSKANIGNGNFENRGTSYEYELHRLRKMKIENLYCVAPLKAYEIALGMSNGEIRILNYKSNEYVNKFTSETSKHSVINLDFSSLDEHLASVLENGCINVYGMKTKAKLESINLDGNSTLAKFNPKRRLRLAIASYKGSVFLYDVQANRKIFQAVETHSAPCRDIAISPTNPDVLYSAGYDSVINIYDTKKRVRVQQLKCRYPLSTITVSECGNYCCTGNLKGELICYDLRLLKSALCQRKVHESATIRVAFVPTAEVNMQSSVFPLQVQNETSTETNRLSNCNNDNAMGQKRDSFFDYIEFQNLRVNHRVSDLDNMKNIKKQRESFDWEQLATRKFETDKRLSNRISMNVVKRKISEDSSNFQKIDHSTELCSKEKSQNNSNNSESKLNFESKIIEEVNEDELLIEDDLKTPPIDLNEVEEIEIQQKKNIEALKIPNKNARSSTPKNLDINENEEHQNGNASNENFSLNFEILRQIKELKLEVETRFKYLENEIKFNAEENKWNIYSQNFNFWNKQDKVNNDISDALDILLHSDDFYQDYCRLKEENEQLKLTVEELSRKNSI